MALAGVPSGLVVKTSLSVRHSPPGIRTPITGIRMSATSELTTFPTAAPMMTPTANASALVDNRNFLKSSSISAPFDWESPDA